jgi:hypothetical protein
MVQSLGDQNAHQLLCYLTGEELAQFVFGTALVGFLVFGIEKRLLAGLDGAMLILTLFQHFEITPDLSWMGRSVDFVTAAVESQVRDQFWKLHGIYNGIEVGCWP